MVSLVRERLRSLYLREQQAAVLCGAVGAGKPLGPQHSFGNLVAAGDHLRNILHLEGPHIVN